MKNKSEKKKGWNGKEENVNLCSEWYRVCVNVDAVLQYTVWCWKNRQKESNVNE